MHNTNGGPASAKRNPSGAYFVAFFWFVSVGLIVVVAALLLANNVVPVGALVDAPFFQFALTLIICLIIAVALFAFFEKSTATLSIPEWSQATLKLGGPIAGFVAMLLVVFPNLTPTARIILYFRDGTLTAARPGQVFRIENGLDVLLALPEGAVHGKSSETDVVFPYLPKGQDIPINLDSQRYHLVGIYPKACSASDEGEFKLKAGCRSAYLCVADAVAATFTNLRDLPPTNLGLPARVTLRQAVQAYISELQSSAVARDKNAVVSSPNWASLGGTSDISFAWRRPPQGSGTCVVASAVQTAFNNSNPKAQIDVIVNERGISVRPRSSTGDRPNDICSTSSSPQSDPIELAAACDH